MNAAQSAAGSKKKYPIDCKGVLAYRSVGHFAS